MFAVAVCPLAGTCRLFAEDDRTMVADPLLNSVPSPAKATVCDKPLTLSVMVSAPARTPAVVGVNTTDTVQLAPAAMLPPQVVVCAKSPDTDSARLNAAALLELVTVTACATLVVPSTCEANVRLPGRTDARLLFGPVGDSGGQLTCVTLAVS